MLRCASVANEESHAKAASLRAGSGPGLAFLVSRGAFFHDVIPADFEHLIQGRVEILFVRVTQLAVMGQLDDGLASLLSISGLVQKRQQEAQCLGNPNRRGTFDNQQPFGVACAERPGV